MATWYVGQTWPVWSFTLQQPDANPINTPQPVDLTGAALSLALRNINSSVEVSGTGTWAITDAINGMATYTPAAADVATAGTYLIVITATYSGGKVVLWRMPLVIEK